MNDRGKKLEDIRNRRVPEETLNKLAEEVREAQHPLGSRDLPSNFIGAIPPQELLRKTQELNRPKRDDPDISQFFPSVAFVKALRNHIKSLGGSDEEARADTTNALILGVGSAIAKDLQALYRLFLGANDK